MEKLADLIGAFGALIAMLMILAAVVEVILEMVRGACAASGLLWAKKLLTVEQALKLAESSGQSARNALKVVADLVEAKSDDDDKRAEAIDARADDPTRLSHDVDEKKRQRVTILRTLAAGLGGVLVAALHLKPLALLEGLGEAAAGTAIFAAGDTVKVVGNALLGGLAAAAGSSYWHDVLDQVRNVKSKLPSTVELTAEMSPRSAGVQRATPPTTQESGIPQDARIIP